VENDYVEYIPVKKLTKRQREVLTILSSGEELVFEKGAGWWLGLDRVGGKLPITLLRHMTIRADDYSSSVQRYTINETGRKSLTDNCLYLIRKK